MRENLQAARKAHKLTQQAIADKLGVGLRHYQKIESGETNGSFEIWDALRPLYISALQVQKCGSIMRKF